MNTTKHLPVLNLFMPNGGEAGVIYAWVAGSIDVKEFSGPPLSKQVAGKDHSPFGRVYRELNQMHRDELGFSRIITVLPNQRDHSKILELMDAPLGNAPKDYGHGRIRHRVTPNVAPTYRVTVKRFGLPAGRTAVQATS